MTRRKKADTGRTANPCSIIDTNHKIMGSRDKIEAMQYDVFPDRLHLRRTDLARNMSRFYELVVQRDLFGGAVLSCE